MNAKEKNATLAKEAKVISVLEHCLVYPANLMKPLCTAICQHTTKPVTSNVTDIKLYGVYCKESGAFLGSFYAMDYAGKMYGNVAGSREIVYFEKDAFKFEKMEDFYFPVKDERFLKCKFDWRGSLLLKAVALVEMGANLRDEEVCHTFGEDVPFFNGLIECNEIISKL